MYLLKPVEQGLDVKFTAAIHRGCLRIQAAVDGNIIKTAKDLRGKRIGVPGMGTPPFIFANRVLTANGINASRDVTWSVFPAGSLQPLWSGLRERMRTVCPLIAAAVFLLTGWELTTAGFRLLPLPYFPSPAGVL
jgi:ABC-type nitrate/sulfonate/bicarbonate transport system substrate-binding protein